MRTQAPLVALSFLLLSLSGQAQKDSSEGKWNTFEGYQKIQKGSQKKDSGSVVYIQSPLLDSIVAEYRHFNEEFPKIQGYRIQLFFGKRGKAEKLKAEFQKGYPDTEAYIDYLAPNFRLRVGNFRTRIDAYRFMQEMGTDFGRSYIVRTKIELPSLSIEGEAN